MFDIFSFAAELEEPKIGKGNKQVHVHVDILNKMHFCVRCPNPVNFDIPLLIILLSAIKTLNHHGEISLTLYHTIPTLNNPKKKKIALKTLWEKEKMLVTSIFSFSHNVFYPSQSKFQSFIYIYFVVCKCFNLGTV